MDRIKLVLKRKGMTMKRLAECIGISRESLYSRLKNAKLETIKEVAKCLDVEPIELIETVKDHQHVYNSDGDWQGVLKK